MLKLESERFELGFAESSLNLLAARATAVAMRPVTRQAPETRLRLVQRA
jgi:hypothetical protein